MCSYGICVNKRSTKWLMVVKWTSDTLPQTIKLPKRIRSLCGSIARDKRYFTQVWGLHMVPLQFSRDASQQAILIGEYYQIICVVHCAMVYVHTAE